MNDDRTWNTGGDETISANDVPSTPDMPEVNETVGPYRLIRRVGEGGMGSVYLAEQQEPIRRQVALKVIKHGMDTAEVVGRFQSERQALALMDHPCIAKVFDAGTTERGRPYFVMEYIDGLPITRHCDVHELGIKERLELFLRVCDGIQHAHQKAIIHRDIKTSNVLVTVHDGQAVPKIIDFGIAKAISQRAAEETVFTELGQMVGTPEYMSPEQAELGGRDIDTRTDVYSLGVLLYELLAGVLPFTSRELRQSGFDEIRRIIREEDPPPPSKRLLTADAILTTALDKRHTDPNTLARRVRGDLDWITMRALEKQRSRRYSSPGDLAADLRRYLADEPVDAGPPSRSYRAGKFARRHRMGVGVSAGLLVVLILFASTMTVQAKRIARTRDQAELEAAKATQTAAFAQSMLSGIDPKVARGRDTELLELVFDETEQRIDAELSGQPEVEATIRHTLGRAYGAIGKYDQAARHLQVADSLQTTHLGAEHRTTLTTRSRYASLLMDRGQHDESEQIHREVLAARRRILGDDDPDVVHSLNGLAVILTRVGKSDEAEGLLVEAIETGTALHGNEHATVNTARAALGIAYYRQGRIAEAELVYRELLAIRRRTLGTDHPRTLETQGNLAFFLDSQGKYEEAEALHDESVALAIDIFGAEHPQTLKLKNNRAVYLVKRDKLDEGAAAHEEVLAVRQQVLGAEHPETLMSMSSLGEAYLLLERYAEAEALLGTVLDAQVRTLGDEHADTQFARRNLARLYHAQQKMDEAAALLGDIAEAQRRVLGDGDQRLTLEYYNWAAALQDGGHHDQAAPVFREVLAIYERSQEPPKPWIPAALNGTAKSLAHQDKHAAADSFFVAGLEMRQELFGAESAEAAYSHLDYGSFLMDRGSHSEAESHLRACYEIRLQVLEPTDWRLPYTGSTLGESLARQNRYAEAEPLLVDGYLALKEMPYVESTAAIAHDRLVGLYEDWGRPDEAEKWRQQ